MCIYHDDEDGKDEPVKKKPKESYKNSQKFQLSWVAKCPWTSYY
jgi:hypothetical protein